ncbi:hypothetical protein [Anaerobiospirillum sp. NML120511]|uniref:hypothetical protein n=1 Tax=Anaerobiospirillum sp. NML120511 TaxID=2932819 RepID=UPI001FF211FD|nr:hypothetical protein [Anaerobiospirillum sp. NML120511]MCK0535133.1 hypothetical protein [Anaerobiospirillum sp. NML120511]
MQLVADASGVRCCRWQRNTNPFEQADDPAAACATRTRSNWQPMLPLAAQQAPVDALLNVQTALSLHKHDDVYAALAASYTA